MNILQTALEAIELLLTDNTSEQAQAAAADARIKLMNAVAMEPVAWITTHEHSLLCYTKAEADTFCSNDESSIPLYLHPPQQVAAAAPQQAKQVPMTETHIRATWSLLDDNNTKDIVLRFARELEAHHHIGSSA